MRLVVWIMAVALAGSAFARPPSVVRRGTFERLLKRTDPVSNDFVSGYFPRCVEEHAENEFEERRCLAERDRFRAKYRRRHITLLCDAVRVMKYDFGRKGFPAILDGVAVTQCFWANAGAKPAARGPSYGSMPFDIGFERPARPGRQEGRDGNWDQQGSRALPIEEFFIPMREQDEAERFRLEQAHSLTVQAVFAVLGVRKQDEYEDRRALALALVGYRVVAIDGDVMFSAPKSKASRLTRESLRPRLRK